MVQCRPGPSERQGEEKCEKERELSRQEVPDPPTDGSKLLEILHFLKSRCELPSLNYTADLFILHFRHF